MCGEQLQALPIPRVCEGIGGEDLNSVLKRFNMLERDIALHSGVEETTIRPDGDSLGYATQSLPERPLLGLPLGSHLSELNGRVKDD